MKRSTLRSLLALTVIFDVALAGVLLYDYFQNESDWALYLIVAFCVFLLVALILFLLSGRSQPAPEPVVVKETVTVVEALAPQAAPEHKVVFHEIRPIPPAPIRALRENPPRRIAAPARPVASGIPFVYNGYTLFTREVQLKNGGKRAIYFFSKKKPKSGRMCAKPVGYHVGVNERTGLPFLKKGGGPDGEDLTPTSAAADEYRPQCSALTEEGVQCRNSAREGSKYCAPHFGYQPPTMSRAQTDRTDTVAAVEGAPDTKPSTRKSWFGRKKSSA